MFKYGSVEWLEGEYSKTSSDPWGLIWRPTQLFRYVWMLSELRRYMIGKGIGAKCVVDVGCATGDFTELLHRELPPDPGRRVVGIDVSGTAIERARKRHPGLEFHVSQLAELQSCVGPEIDMLCCLEVLYYLPPDERFGAIEAFFDALRPGGLLLVSSMIGKPPYLTFEQLEGLAARRFEVIGASCLELWPLIGIEKAIMKLVGRLPGFRLEQFMPGRRGFVAMTVLMRLSQTLFRQRARSHAFVLAVRR